MRKVLTMLTLALLAGPALADDDCRVPLADWQPRAAVEALAHRQGWTVERIRIDDGCYELRGRDGEGHAIKVTIDPGNLELVEMRIRYRDGAGRGGQRDDD